MFHVLIWLHLQVRQSQNSITFGVGVSSAAVFNKPREI